jgi:dolichyl-phosphate-mannose--protein O-mannosyl transferase
MACWRLRFLTGSSGDSKTDGDLDSSANGDYDDEDDDDDLALQIHEEKNRPKPGQLANCETRFRSVLFFVDL